MDEKIQPQVVFASNLNKLFLFFRLKLFEMG